MKKKIFLVLICGICILGITGCGKNNKEVELYNRDSLEILSENDDYIIAVSKKNSELNTYSMYKIVNHYNYKKVWDFSGIDSNGIEKRQIIWTDKNVYIFGYNPTAYNLTDGSDEYSINLIDLLNGTPGNFDRFLGHDDSFIYYEYSHNGDEFYGKVNMNLSSAEAIDKESIPADLKR